MILIISPLEYHIIKTGPDDRKDHPVQHEIQIDLRILSPPFCILLGHQKTHDHPDSDDQAIICKGYSKNGEAFCRMLDGYPQVYKA